MTKNLFSCFVRIMRRTEQNNSTMSLGKRTKTAKELYLKEQTSTPSTSKLHDAEVDNDTATPMGKASKVKKKKPNK